MNKTVKELADEIGVSKTAIYKKVNENQRKLWFSKIGNRFVINDEGQNAIKSMFDNKIENHKPQTDNLKLITENSEPQTDNQQVYDLNAQLLKQIDSQALQIEGFCCKVLNKE